MLDRQALVVGIDHYEKTNDLESCVNDATRIRNLLKRNGDEQESENFHVELLTSTNGPQVTARNIRKKLSAMFRNRLQMAVFYFAGHGYVDPDTDEGYLVTQDGNNEVAWGISVSSVMKLANDSPALSKFIILDCCHSGSMGSLSAQRSLKDLAVLGPGVTIMTASREDQVAVEIDAHGLFTSLLIDGLEGGAADVEGRITVAAIYAHIDRALVSLQQRPLFKANVQSMAELRCVKPKIEPRILRDLATHFQQPGSIYSLGPECEPHADRGNLRDRYLDVAVDPVKRAIYQDLQKCVSAGLVKPYQQEHMWHAAMYSSGCKLTNLGRFYRDLKKDH